MLKSFFRELQNILGDEYALFQEFDTKVAYSGATKKKYKNIGVFYATGGQFNLLPNGAGVSANFRLEMFMRVDDTYTDSSPVVKPLERLAKSTNGVIYAESDGEQVAYNYVFNCGVPTSDGNLIEGAGHYWIVYEIPMDAVISNTLLLSDGGEFKFTIDGQKLKLNGVVSSTESPNVIPEVSLIFNKTSNQSITLGRNWGMQIVANYMPHDPLHRFLRNLIRNTPEIPIEIEYSLDGDTAPTTRLVLFHDCVFTNERGQFATMILNMSEALNVEELSNG